MTIKKFMSAAMFCLALSACDTPAAVYHKKAVSDDSGDRVSVGTVQKEIRVGMSGADVAAALGSPNIVTSDEERRETWIYDKIATDRVYSSSSDRKEDAGASSTTQKTLTVIIKFDKSGNVRDFAYHTSKF